MARNGDADAVVELAAAMIGYDTRSERSNLPLAEFLEERLRGGGYAIERIDYADPRGTPKRALVALRGRRDRPCVALSGHLDTVPPAGWTRDPLRADVEDGRLYGLGSTDMKGPIAAAMVAADGVGDAAAVMLLLTCDEEVDKGGARAIAADSRLVREVRPAGIVVVEPTGLACVRGHRVDIQFRAEAHGVQAHSSTADGRNANISLIPFLADMRALHLRLREDARYHDPAYDPPWCDLNIVIDNHGAAPNVTVGLATCRMKLRYSKAIDPEWIAAEVERSAAEHGLELTVRREAPPPELPEAHPLVEVATAVAGTPPRVTGFGTDASELSRIAPCIVFGPGSIDDAHRPDERIALDQLARAVPQLRRIIADYARRCG